MKTIVKFFTLLITLCVVMALLPAVAFAETRQVNFVSIGGIDTPKVGAKPDTTAVTLASSEGAQISTEVLSVKWRGTFDNYGKFKNGEPYTVDVKVGIKSGYDAIFSKDIKVPSRSKYLLINGIQATVIARTDSELTLCYVFPKLDKSNSPAPEQDTSKKISEIHITGITEPAYGKKADTTAHVSHAGLNLRSVEWFGSVWEPSEPYVYGSNYTVVVTLEIKSGYTVDESICSKTGTEKVTINGKNAVEVEIYQDKYVMFRYNYPELKPSATDSNPPVEKIVIDGVVQPIEGKALDYEYSVNSNAGYSVSAFMYEGKLGPDGIALPNSDYKLKIMVTAKGKKKFSDKLNTVGKSNSGIKASGGSCTVLRWSETEIVFERSFKTKRAKGERPAVLKKSPYVFEGGSGTYTDPYLIATADQLNAIRQGMDKHYKLIADIDLSGWGNWIPIGSTEGYGGNRGGNSVNMATMGSEVFTGSLDGNGHVISGMTIKIDANELYMQEQGNVRYYSLFMSMDANRGIKIIHDVGSRSGSGYTSEVHAGVRNLGMINYNIDVKHRTEVYDYTVYAGAIAGTCHGVGIYNCYASDGSIRIDGSEVAASTRIRVGGLVGQSTWTDFRNCYNASPLTILGNDAHPALESLVGGISADAMAVWFMSCYNNGNLTTHQYDYSNIDIGSTTSVAAGITAICNPPEFPVLYHSGEAVNTYIWNCYNTGTLTGTSAGGITFYGGSDFYIDNCYNTGALQVNQGTDAFIRSYPIYATNSEITKFGEEYVRRTYTEGNSVSGNVWAYSSALGRKVLAAIPEDNKPALNPSFVSTGRKTPFADVLSGSYYEDAVVWALSEGVTSGMSVNEFAPNFTCTRGQVVTFLWRACGSPVISARTSFEDVSKDAYYYNAVKWAIANNITAGTSKTTFSPDKTCTSAEVITFLYRANMKPAANGTSSVAQAYPGQWYTDAVAWADTTGLLAGVGAPFAPNNNSPRADIVTYLSRNAKK